MKKILFIALWLLVICTSQTIYAATLIESKESKAGLQKTWIEGTKLRVESGEGEQYMLMDFSRRTMHIVNPDKKQVIDMSKVITSHTESNREVNRPEYTVNHKGKGPSVAGYQTEHYVVSLNGERCFESFTSQQAVKELGLEHFISGMNEMFPRENSMDAGDNPCLNAENALDYTKIGIPLRLLEQNGEEIYSITKLEKNTPVPAGGLSVPEGYTVIDYGQMVQQMIQPAQQ